MLGRLGIKHMIYIRAKLWFLILVAMGWLSQRSANARELIQNRFQPIVQQMDDLVGQVEGKEDAVTKLVYETRIAINRFRIELSEQGITAAPRLMDGINTLKYKLSVELQKLPLNNADSRGASMQDALKQEEGWKSLRTGKKALEVIDNFERLVIALRKEKSDQEAQPNVTACVIQATNQPQKGIAVAESKPQTSSSSSLSSRASSSSALSFVPLIQAQPRDIMLDRTTLFASSLNDRKPVSVEWKNKTARDFYQDVSYLKDVVVQGESPQEARDFVERFEKQSRWFDYTLATTRFVSDPSYQSLTQKCARLHDIVAVQKKAEQMLLRTLEPLKLPSQEANKVRVNLLYNLYALMPEHNGLAHQSLLPVTMTEQRIREEVVKMVQRLQPTQGEFPGAKVANGQALSSSEFDALMKPVLPTVIGSSSARSKEQASSDVIIPTQEFDELMKPVLPTVIAQEKETADQSVKQTDQSVERLSQKTIQLQRDKMTHDAAPLSNKDFNELMSPVLPEYIKTAEASKNDAKSPISKHDFDELMRPLPGEKTDLNEGLLRGHHAEQKSPLEEVRSILRDNRRYFEEVKEIAKQRERQADKFLLQAIKDQEIERLKLEIQIKKADGALEEIKIARQELVGNPDSELGVVSFEKSLEKKNEGNKTAASDEKKNICLLNDHQEPLQPGPQVQASLKRMQYEVQLAQDRLQEELIGKQELHKRIETLDRKNSDLIVMLKSAEIATDHARKQAMVMVAQRTQEVRDELTKLMAARLQEKTTDVTGQSSLIKQHQALLEAQEKKYGLLEQDLQARSQQITELQKDIIARDQRLVQLDGERTQMAERIEDVTRNSLSVESKLKNVQEEKDRLNESLKLARVQVERSHQEAQKNARMYVELDARASLANEASHRSIKSLEVEREMLSKLLAREKWEAEMKIAELKSKLLSPTTLPLQQGGLLTDNHKIALVGV